MKGIILYWWEFVMRDRCDLGCLQPITGVLRSPQRPSMYVHARRSVAKETFRFLTAPNLQLKFEPNLNLNYCSGLNDSPNRN